MMDKPNGRIFFLKMMTCYKYIILSGITSALIKKKKELDSESVYNKKTFENQNKTSWR